MSVPPVTAWLSYLIIALGKTVFWVKFFPALFGALTVWVVWKITETLGGNLFALSLSALCVTLSVLLRMNTLYQPNSLEFLLWTTMFFTIIRFVQSQENKWLWYTGITFAFGFLNKYNISFLVLGLLPAMLLTQQRKLFANKQLYLVALVTNSLFIIYLVTCDSLTPAVVVSMNRMLMTYQMKQGKIYENCLYCYTYDIHPNLMISLIFCRFFNLLLCS